LSFIRYKQRGQKWYVYKASNEWDKGLKKYKQVSVYLGIADVKGGAYQKQERLLSSQVESGIVDFGDGYAIAKFIQNSKLFAVMQECFDDLDSIMSLICYQLTCGSAMYDCQDWFDGNVASKLFPCAKLSSQNISSLIKSLGKEGVQRKFFKSYITAFFQEKHGILIDSTALPSAINSSLNAWGHTASGIEKNVTCLLLVDKTSKLPIFFRAIPGSIADVSTLKITLDEIAQLGLQTSQAIFDAGYFSEDNIKYLCEQKINFVSRMPKSRCVFKSLITTAGNNIESASNAVVYGKRVVFIKSQEVDLYGHKMFAHIVLDPEKKAKAMNMLILDAHANPTEARSLDEEMKHCGFFILISKEQIDKEDILPSYYTRQSIEQVFGFAKTNNLLPLRVHSDPSINGYLLLLFISMIVFIQLRQKLQSTFTVEQALLILRNLKAKVYDKSLVPLELTKKAKDIFNSLNLTVPIPSGI
jgi:transposase